ncbi:MAG: hypothetical protein Q8N42_01395 [bacterium]|nr:hypothetical protein [bacterium]
MLSIEEIKNLALLARIELSAREEKELQKELEAILDYVSHLKKAPPSPRRSSAKQNEGGLRPFRLGYGEASPLSAKGTEILEVFNVSRGDKPVKEEADIKKGEHIKVKHIL